MATSLLVPMHVEAKVLPDDLSVPDLQGGPFNTEATLEAGIHLHWALPDALTRARFVETDKGRRTLFPGVPDLWLVVRFDPHVTGESPSGRATTGLRATSAVTRELLRHASIRRPLITRSPGSRSASGRTASGPTLGRTPPLQPAGPAKRSWTAWVVDSRSGITTPLDDWEPSDDADPDRVHTFAGLLPAGDAVDAPGWGLWNPAEQGSFDPAVAAYYPAARSRFGFHDDLAELGTTGQLCYSVVGWYGSPSHDPLHASPDRKAQLAAWKFAWKVANRQPLRPMVSSDIARAAFQPSSARLQRPPLHRQTDASERIARIRRAATRGEEERTAMRQAAVHASMTELSSSLSEVGSLTAVGLGHLTGVGVPAEIVCHGAISEIPLSPPATEEPGFEHRQIRVYPSVKAAMAAVASLDEAANVDMVEALLQSLDGQQAKTQSGVVDLPAALHALSFQSAPGKSRHFAQIRIWSAVRRARKGYGVSLSPASAMSTASTALGADGRVGSATPRRSSGHWPAITARSAASTTSSHLEHLVPEHLQKVPTTAKPFEPTEAEVDQWMDEVADALADAFTAAAGDGTPIDPHVVRVQDSRRDASPTLLGPAAGGRGTDGASYWVDVRDRGAMRRLLIATHGAQVALPDPAALHEVPGPRWYRPWSPHVVVTGQGRSFRFGEDGRFEESGFLRCRSSGETLVSLKTDIGKSVLARDVVQSLASLGTHAGLPPEARSLAEETTLLDAENAPGMASVSLPGASGPALAGAVAQFRAASRAVLLLRDASISSAHRAQILSMLQGRPPSPVAFLSWRDPWEPMFVDIGGAHPYSSLESDWTIDGEDDGPTHVEFRPLGPESTAPPAGQVELFTERTLLTSTIVHTLESALITKVTLDKYGNLIPSGAPPGGVNEDTFKKVAVLSAPLTGFDTMVQDRGRRERSGALRLNRLDIVDAFGARRSWDSQIPDPSSTGGDDTLPWWTALPPRLPFWSRLQFRLMSAEQDGQQATFTDSPLCGFVVPDLFEHSLEVYDASGRALGQILSDPPQRGSAQAATLDVWFDVHPWMADELELGPDDDPLDAVTNPRLRAFVAGVVAQGGVHVPPNQPDTAFFETGQTALMRIIDTLRPSIDPKESTSGDKVRMVGGPIAVLAAKVWLEATGETAPEALLGDPPTLAEPPSVPTLRVQIGDQNRPDDGVFGCFLPHTDPAASRFAPVSVEAAEKATLNEIPVHGISQRPAEHPFVAGLESVFPVALGQPRELTVLVEAGASLHAVCGALPRKKLVVPREFLAGVEALEPTFRVGPLLSVPTLGSLQPLLPAPQVQGHEVSWLRYEPAPAPEEGAWQATSVPPLPPIGSVPPERIRLSQGWMRLTRARAKED